MQAQIKKRRNLGKDVQDSGRTTLRIAHNKGKEPAIPNDVDTPADDELSSCSSPSLSLSLTKNAREGSKEKSCKRPSHHPAFSDAVSGESHRASKETDTRQNQPIQALGNSSLLAEGAMPPVLLVGTMPPMPLVHPTFITGPTFYMPTIASIRGPDYMLYSPLGQHILDYEPPREFDIPAFAMFDGSANPYDHMFHYTQAMILNDGNDHLLCKVFSANFRGPALTWFHKLLRNSKTHSVNYEWHSYRSIFVRCGKRGISTPYRLFSSKKKRLFETSQGGSAKPSSR